jgi:hypothetical protein
MYKNISWLSLLCVVGLVAFWFSAKAGYQIYHYCALNNKVKVQVTDFSVEQIKDHYAVRVGYKFVVENRKYRRKEVLRRHIYKSSWMAQSVIKDLKRQKAWLVWYNKSDIKHATFNKIFPMKVFLYGVVILGLFLYFLILGRYVSRFK